MVAMFHTTISNRANLVSVNGHNLKPHPRATPQKVQDLDYSISQTEVQSNHRWKIVELSRIVSAAIVIWY